jgi:hypothetical protein
MRNSILMIVFLVFSICHLQAQMQFAEGDSAIVRLQPQYNKVSKFHKLLFGENYRKEWDAPVKLPMIRLSHISDGLTVVRRGGGMQTASLRLKDKNGKEWALRSVEKNPEVVLPEPFRQTFAREWVEDAMSAQHPYAALMIPVIANAVKVPHSSPMIGLVMPDSALGPHARDFVNKVCLLEEREPLGESEDTEEMMEDLNKDHDNSFDKKVFIRARLLDLLISDWDRHPDQWRWLDTLKGKGKYYVAIPRDRDQALYINEGLFPFIASIPGLVPTLQGLDKKISNVKYSLYKSNFLNPYPASYLSYSEWMDLTKAFTKAVTDSVLEAALQRLPPEIYQIRHDELLNTLKSRRDAIPAAMQSFYRFIHKIVDIRISDKHEWVSIRSTNNKALQVSIFKKSKEGAVSDTILSGYFEPDITKEIRLFVADGWDSVTIDNPTSPIRIRLVGGKGRKVYHVLQAKKKIKLYGRNDNTRFAGASNRLIQHLSNDSLNTAIERSNPYHVTIPILTVGYNIDDGVLLGIAFKHIHQGFRKKPYGSLHQVSITHSLSTHAYRFRYKAEWMQALGKADVTLQAQVNAPNNTINFFGRGNETRYVKGDNRLNYYRARFSSYLLEPAVRFAGNKESSISIGPSYQLYTYDRSDNKDRFIQNAKLFYAYDSATLDRQKVHAGLVVLFTHDKRNNKIIPTSGVFSSIRMQGYTGLNKYSKSFVQVIPEVGFYKSLNSKSTIVLAERLSGGVTIGKTAFYQSLFLGAHENLWGYRQYRFAGQHRLSNNLELHVKLADINGYILPGQIGCFGFYDVGRVWEQNEKSKKWHQGVGGGLYFAPAQMVVITAVAGYSKEGWYPQVGMGFRF